MTKFIKVPLGEVISINPDSVKHDYQFKEIEYVDISAIDSNTLSATTLYSLEKAPSRAKRLVKDGDTILATVRPNLRSYLLIKQPKSNLVVSTGFAVLRATSRINHRFLYYIVADQSFTDYLTANAKGSAYPAVDNDIIKRAEILLPPLPTQKKIASILSSYDDLIENNTRRIKILEEMAQILYREWFVNFRFPNHENVKMVESDLGLIPEGWKVVNLGKIAKVKGGKRLPKGKELLDKKTANPYIRVKDMTDSGLDTSDIKYIDEETHQSIKRYIIYQEDIYISIAGTIGRVGTIPKSLSGANLTENAAKICEIKEIDCLLLLSYLRSEAGQGQIASRVVGTSQPKLALFRIEEILVPLPPASIQDNITSFISNCYEHIENLKTKNQKLRETRDLLLPKLISGEIDVENLGIETLEVAA